MESVVVSRVLLLAAVLLVGVVMAHGGGGGGGGGGFSVGLIHRDSAMSPFHDPALSEHDRVLAAARRSTARAAELGASRGGGDVVSEVVSRSFEYLMSINVGTPPVQMLAIVDTGSDLVWVNCDTKDNATAPTAAASPPTSPAAVVFDPSASSSYALAGCDSTACQALGDAAGCDANSNCSYSYSYGDGSRTIGLLATETFTFDDGESRGRQVRERVSFGCSTVATGTFRADGLVGLGGGVVSLATQLGEDSSLDRKFSYCLVPYAVNQPSALNFGARATVSEPGAATTPLIASQVDAYYTVSLESVKVAGKAVAAHQSAIIVDSGTTLTYLDQALLGPLVDELTKRIKLPRAESPDKLLTLCYDAAENSTAAAAAIPDVTLVLGGGAAVTLKPENTFVHIKERTMCLVLVAASDAQPVSILGNIAQQNLHVGYDLNERTVTFAAANCAAAAAAPPS